MDTKKLIGFLHTFWGQLAVATAAIPGIATLFKVSIALENSPIKAMHPILGTAMASFVVLFLVSRPGWFILWKRTAVTAIITMIVGLSLLIFLLFSRSMQDYQSQSTFPANSLQGMIAMPELFTTVQGSEFLRSNSGQQVEIRKIWDRGRGTNELIVNGQVRMHSEYSNVAYEIVLLSLFVLSIACLTAAFTALGVHAYVMKSQSLNLQH